MGLTLSHSSFAQTQAERSSHPNRHRSLFWHKREAVAVLWTHPTVLLSYFFSASWAGLVGADTAEQITTGLINGGEPTVLFSGRRKAVRKEACEDDRNSAMPGGNGLNRSCDRSDAPMVEVVRGRTRERFSTEFCGSWVQGRSGVSCGKNTRRTRSASAASSGGQRGQTGAHPACAGGAVAGPRETATRGGFYRYLLRGGKKGVSRPAPPNAARERKPSLSPMITVFLPPLVSKALRRTKAQLVVGVLGHSFLDCLPKRLMGDRAYDSDRLDRDLVDRYV
jgi:hypothetical protein